MKLSKMEAAIYGSIIGDALGLPYEFSSRDELKEKPAADMTGYGTYDLEPGSWSDDTSMTLCLMDSLYNKKGFDANDVMQRFSDWYFNGKYTPDGVTFDVGRTCQKAIQKWNSKKYTSIKWGPAKETDNGNGSLMRISPLPFYIMSVYGKDAFSKKETFKLIHDVSRLTHGHNISLLGCDFYCAIMHEILLGTKKEELKTKAISKIREYASDKEKLSLYLVDYLHFAATNFSRVTEDSIKSTGFVVDSLEAAFWCFMTTENYKDCVLKAVNLGGDTDTIAAIAGSFAGAYYGELPKNWLNKLRNKALIDGIYSNFCKVIEQ